GAHQDLLVPLQRHQGAACVREGSPVGRGRVPVQGGRAVRLRREDHDRPLRLLQARAVPRLCDQGTKPGGELQGDHLLPGAAPSEAGEAAGGAYPQPGPQPRGAPAEEGGEPASRDRLPQVRAEGERGRGERGLERAVHRGRGPR
ncbi:unnamed protein product, partial [Ectocarpus fasciculatus]